MNYKPTPDEVGKFLKYVKNIGQNTCWEWTGARLGNGYGRVHFKDGGKYRQFSTHRIAFELWRGPIPDGLQIDHLCRNRGCCNPYHLEAVTAKENTNRSIPFWNRRKSICPQGHDIASDDKVYVYRNKRICKICMSARVKKYQSSPEYRLRRNALRRKKHFL